MDDKDIIKILTNIRKMEDRLLNISIKNEDRSNWDILQEYGKELHKFVDQLRKKGIK